MHTLPADCFSYHRECHELVAEASDLGLQPGQSPSSFALQNKRGETIEFRLDDVAENEGDITAWLYRPTDPHWQTEGLTAHILND